MMNTSLSIFQNRLIDYAGLFPPANLSLDSAINNYAHYKNSDDSWMLGPFILPVSQLKQLDSYIHLFSEEIPLTLSITGRKSSSETECKMQFQEDIKHISAFIDQYGNRVKVEMVEIPLPPDVPSLDLLVEISSSASDLNMKVFCEVPLIRDWKNHVSETLDAITAHNSLKESWIGVKLRTGGIKAEMFPSPEQVAFVMASCRDRNLAMKFTAGLHHPIRMYRDEVKTKMHGFFNIFMAGMLAATQNLHVKKIEEILLDENSSSFSFHEDRLAWQHLSVTSQEIDKLRKTSLLSFGSCSFDEPKDELMELKNQQEAIL
ncbi:hypothetical protein [Peribacillus asahii]|uniref:hypothetical protein n=1 Tax=Peribacillus asahii TaxID=228899 RepID=UPI00207ACC2B|nr:hypothetical protein [Peribacillus asahii]USK70902.1 hypothetical protein LIS76_03815 [Peribacillus asahii]